MSEFNSIAGSTSGRKLETKETRRFSPSYGVRKGFIKDPNWPPAQFPDEGNATDRRFRRIACSFKVRNDDGELISTSGDISEGGARFTLKRPLVTDTVELVGGNKKARAEIIATVSTVNGYVYRTRFLDTVEAAPVFAAITANA
jgi:PilZ domain